MIKYPITLRREIIKNNCIIDSNSVTFEGYNAHIRCNSMFKEYYEGDKLLFDIFIENLKKSKGVDIDTFNIDYEYSNKHYCFTIEETTIYCICEGYENMAKEIFIS